MFTVNSGVESFCIVGPDGDESPLAGWGEATALQVGSEVYICIGDPDKEQQTVERVSSTEVQETTTVHVLFEGEVEPDSDVSTGEDDEAEEEEEDDEEEEEVGPELVK